MTDEAALASTGEGWQVVTLPHTWNAHDAASTNATVPYKRGRGWYQLASTRRDMAPVTGCSSTVRASSLTCG